MKAEIDFHQKTETYEFTVEDGEETYTATFHYDFGKLEEVLVINSDNEYIEGELKDQIIEACEQTGDI